MTTRSVTSLEEVDALAQELRSAGRIGVAAITIGSAATSAPIGWSFSAERRPGALHPARPLGPGRHTEPARARRARARSDRSSRIRPSPRSGTTSRTSRWRSHTTAASWRASTSTRWSRAICSTPPDRDTTCRRSRSSARATAATADEDVTGRGVKAVTLDAVPPTLLAAYAGERADLPLALADGLRADLERESLATVYRDLDQPLIPVLAAIERAGSKWTPRRSGRWAGRCRRTSTS